MTTEILDRPPSPPEPHRPVCRWRIVAALGAVALLVLALTIVVVTRLDGERSGEWHAVPPAVSGAPPTTTAPTGTPSTAPSATHTGQPTAAAFRFLPLWPFASAQEAVSWQAEAGAGGHQPWRLDAAATALAFTTGFLEFTTIDRAVGVSYSGMRRG
jgi:hypothetical protein